MNVHYDTSYILQTLDGKKNDKKMVCWRKKKPKFEVNFISLRFFSFKFSSLVYRFILIFFANMN